MVHAANAWHMAGDRLVRLVFLGKFGDVAPAAMADIALPGDVHTLADLKKWVARQEPLLGAAMDATRTRLIVNQCVAHDLSQPVADGDEVAFLPPMSGG
jgi:molybdopterin converting factor small subunit